MRSTLRTLVVALTAFVPIFGFTSQTFAESKPETFKVGVAIALSGPTSPLAQAVLEGLKLAVDQYTEQGGFEVAGRKYIPELLVNDTGGSPANGVAQADKLVLKDDVKVLFGCTYSPVAVPMLAVTQPNKVIEISNSASWEGELGKPGNDFMFKLISSQQDIGDKYIPAIVNKLHMKTAVMILPNHDAGRTYEATYRPLGEKNGVKMFETFFYDPKQTDFYPILTKIKDLNPESIWIGYTNEAAAVVVRQAKELKLNASLVGLGTGITGVAANLPAGGRAEGFVFVTQFDPGSTHPGLVSLMKRYETTFAKKISSDFNYVVWHNQTFHMLVDAMKKAGTVSDTTKIMGEIKGHSYEGPYGIAWQVDQTGLNHYGYFLGEVKDGQDIYTSIH